MSKTAMRTAFVFRSGNLPEDAAPEWSVSYVLHPHRTDACLPDAGTVQGFASLDAAEEARDKFLSAPGAGDILYMTRRYAPFIVGPFGGTAYKSDPYTYFHVYVDGQVMTSDGGFLYETPLERQPLEVQFIAAACRNGQVINGRDIGGEPVSFLIMKEVK